MGFEEELGEQVGKAVLAVRYGFLSCDRPGIYSEGYVEGARWAYEYAKQESQWQPIETAPKDGTEVDLWITPRYGSGFRLVRRMWNGERWISRDYGETSIYVKNATHWRLQPSPPQTESHRQGSSNE